VATPSTTGRPVAATGVPATVRAASELLSALAAPLRMSIVVLLDQHGSRCVHQLVDELGAPQPLVSQHLRVLRGAGLVVGVRRQREVHYALTDPHVGAIVQGALQHAAHTPGATGEPTGGSSPAHAGTGDGRMTR
jgi:ArsR family transcriptional regulator, zinc-responsive transcriptional repressor